MMMHGCKCWHHMIDKVLVLLAWISAVLFFWSSWGNRLFWGFNASYWAWVVVILVLLANSKSCCKCCGGMMMGKGGMCKDGNCDMKHDEHGNHI